MSAFLKKYNHIFPSVMHDFRKAGIDLHDLLEQTGSEPRILEYGAGTGEASLRCALEFPSASVLGADVHDASKDLSHRAEAELGEEFRENANVSFVNLADRSRSGSDVPIAEAGPSDIDRSILLSKSFDLIYSWCVFEHIDLSILKPTIDDLKACINPHGLLYIKINPLYFSSRGSHLSGFLPEPWVHLRYEDATLRRMFHDACTAPRGRVDSIWHQYETLNRLTAEQLKGFFVESGLRIVYEDRKYEGVPDASLKSAYTIDALTTKEVTLILSH